MINCIFPFVKMPCFKLSVRPRCAYSLHRNCVNKISSFLTLSCFVAVCLCCSFLYYIVLGDEEEEDEEGDEEEEDDKTADKAEEKVCY